MKKNLSLAVALMATVSMHAVTEFTGFTMGTPQTFAQWAGEFKDVPGEDFDATAYDYVWVKYSGFTGGAQFTCTYNEWKSKQSWGDVFDAASTPISGESGIAAVKLDKTSKYVTGNAQTDGKYIGDIYAKHIRQLSVQATAAAGATITILGVYFGTADEYKAAAGISTKNHVLHIHTPKAGDNGWDYQLVGKLSSPLKAGNTYTMTMKVKCSEAFSVDFWPNDGVAYPDTKTMYLQPLSATTGWTEVTSTIAPTDYDINNLLYSFGKLNGDLYVDDIKVVDAAGNKLMDSTFDIDYSGWTINGSATVEMLEQETGSSTGITTYNASPVSSPAAYNMQGQRVKANAKGLILMNGKKYLNK